MDSSLPSNLFLQNHPTVRELSRRLHVNCGIEMSTLEIGRMLIMECGESEEWAEGRAETLAADPGEFAAWAKYLSDALVEQRILSERDHSQHLHKMRLGSSVVIIAIVLAGLLTDQLDVAFGAVMAVAAVNLIDEVWGARDATDTGVVSG